MDIKNIKDNKDIQQLVKDLTNDNGIVRQNARASLVAYGQSAVDELADAATSSQDILRWEAVKALAEIEASSTIPVLITALEDKNSGVRWIAAEGLIALGEKSVKPLLKALIEQSDSVFLLEGCHHIFSDLKHQKKLPVGFQVDKLLAVVKNTESKEMVKLLAFKNLERLRQKSREK